MPDVSMMAGYNQVDIFIGLLFEEIDDVAA
jgi:hypothetical protein